MTEDCVHRFKRIMKITTTMAAVCGGNVFNPNFRVNLHTWVVMSAINIYFVFSAYTMYYGLAVDRDWKTSLQSFSVVGSAIQGYSKLLAAIFLRPTLLSLYRKLHQIYADYENDPDYKPALVRQVNLTATILKTDAFLNAVTVIIMVAYPLVYGFITGEKLTIIQFLIPGLSLDTDNGYMLYVICHTFCVVLGGFGNCAGDMVTFISITHVPLFKDVFKIKCRILCREITSKARNQKTTSSLLLEILKWHQHYNGYVEEAEKMFYFIIFVQIFTSVIGICCTMFSILTNSWPAAFVYLTYCLCTLYAYCVLGNLVDVSNDQIEFSIYCDILWYELPSTEQKNILLMFRKSQKSVTLTVGSIMPLSMATALQLTKCIYSYIMMLMRFLSEDV